MTKPKPIQVTDVILARRASIIDSHTHAPDDMLPICQQLDEIGYWSLEVWGGATFDACIRFLKEDPWERLQKLARSTSQYAFADVAQRTELLGYRHYADDVVAAFVQKSADNGIDVFRVFDALNDLRNVETAMKAVKDAGKHAQGTICFTTSPVHTAELYVEQAQQLQDMGADSIVIKDMAGLLTPYGTYELVKAIKDAVPLDLAIHSHSTSGLAPLCQLKGVEAGADRIDTSISAFAGGTSHPSTEAQVAALKDSAYDTGLDLDKTYRHR